MGILQGCNNTMCSMTTSSSQTKSRFVLLLIRTACCRQYTYNWNTVLYPDKVLRDLCIHLVHDNMGYIQTEMEAWEQMNEKRSQAWEKIKGQFLKCFCIVWIRTTWYIWHTSFNILHTWTYCNFSQGTKQYGNMWVGIQGFCSSYYYYSLHFLRACKPFLKMLMQLLY